MFRIQYCKNKICKKRFIPKTYRHVFCSRKCFKLEYKNSMKENKYPLFICPNCRKKIKLDFHPRSSFIKWKKFKCEYCDFTPMAEFEKREIEINIFL